jgi:hypothetical protein
MELCVNLINLLEGLDRESTRVWERRLLVAAMRQAVRKNEEAAVTYCALCSLSKGIAIRCVECEVESTIMRTRKKISLICSYDTNTFHILAQEHTQIVD